MKRAWPLSGMRSENVRRIALWSANVATRREAGADVARSQRDTVAKTIYSRLYLRVPEWKLLAVTVSKNYLELWP